MESWGGGKSLVPSSPQRCWHCRGPARRHMGSFLCCAGITTAPSLTLTPLWSQHARLCSTALPASLSGCLQSHQDQAVHEGCMASNSRLRALQEAIWCLERGQEHCLWEEEGAEPFLSPAPLPTALSPEEGRGWAQAVQPPPPRTLTKQQWVHNHLPFSSSSPDSQRCSREDEQARSQQDSPGAPGDRR